VITDNLISLASTLPVALVEWCFIFWFGRNVKKLSQTSLSQRLTQILFLLCVVGTVSAQLAIYAWVSNARRINDPFLMMVIALESLIGAGILFYVLLKDRSKARSAQEKQKL